MVVGREEFATTILSTWKSSVLYGESLKCKDLVIFILNVCTADFECVRQIDWNVVLLHQRNNVLYYDFCCRILDLDALFVTYISDIDLIYELCHDTLFSKGSLLVEHLSTFSFSPILLDLLDLLVIDQGTKSIGILLLAISIIESIYQPPSRLADPKRSISTLEVKKPLLLNLIASLLDPDILDELLPERGFCLLSILLECCQYDQNIPFTREPSILALSRMTTRGEYNAFINNMKLQSVHPSVTESLAKIGYKAIVQEDNKIAFIKN